MNKFVFILWSLFPRKVHIAEDLYLKHEKFVFIWLGKKFAVVVPNKKIKATKIK